jgi:hypothetical protein
LNYISSRCARYCENYHFRTENPRVGGSIPPLAISSFLS